MTSQSTPPSEDRKSLRFCMVTTFYPPYNFGGDGIFVQRLSRALAERGHYVEVIHCIDAYNISGGDNSPKTSSTDAGVTVHSLKSSWGPISPLITHQLATPGIKAKKLRRLIEDGDFDVIHFHNISLIGGPGVLDYGSAVKLYTAHEYWLLCPLSNLWKYNSAPCEKTNCTQCTLRAGKPPQFWRHTNVIKRKFSQIDAILAPSQFVIDSHHARGMDLDFTLLPNFLPRPQQEPSSSDSPDREASPFFLVVGRLEKTKGFHKVIEAFREKNHAKLVIAGTGPYENELKEMARGADNISFTGYMEYKNLTRLYKNAAAVIVPSIWHEPFGLIVLEAFAQATPVIVNDAGALPELVKTSGGGLTYTCQSELQAHIETMVFDTQKREELGLQGHSAFMSKWTEEIHLEQYFRIIEEAARARGTSLT
jgi:glycosyltransferase involved in cell wall biosynthesis